MITVMRDGENVTITINGLTVILNIGDWYKIIAKPGSVAHGVVANKV